MRDNDAVFLFVLGSLLFLLGAVALNNCAHSDSAMQMRQIVTHPEAGMTCVSDRLTGQLACVRDRAPNP